MAGASYTSRPPGGARRRYLLAGGAVGLLLLGALLGRITAPTPTPPAEEVRPSPAPSPAPSPGPGPTRLEVGVPVGYARTEAGAVAAAAAYVAAFDGPRGLVEADRAAVLDAIAATGAREQLAEAMAPGAALLVETFGLTEDVVRDPGFVARSVLAGYAVDRYSDDEAIVRIWGTSILFAEGRQAISNVWSTETVTLRWERSDWRLVGISPEDGPEPPDTATPPAPGAGERINAFTRFAHVPPPG